MTADYAHSHPLSALIVGPPAGAKRPASDDELAPAPKRKAVPGVGTREHGDLPIISTRPVDCSTAQAAEPLQVCASSALVNSCTPLVAMTHQACPVHLDHLYSSLCFYLTGSGGGKALRRHSGRGHGPGCVAAASSWAGFSGTQHCHLAFRQSRKWLLGSHCASPVSLLAGCDMRHLKVASRPWLV